LVSDSMPWLESNGGVSYRTDSHRSCIWAASRTHCEFTRSFVGTCVASAMQIRWENMPTNPHRIFVPRLRDQIAWPLATRLPSEQRKAPTGRWCGIRNKNYDRHLPRNINKPEATDISEQGQQIRARGRRLKFGDTEALGSMEPIPKAATVHEHCALLWRVDHVKRL